MNDAGLTWFSHIPPKVNRILPALLIREVLQLNLKKMRVLQTLLSLTFLSVASAFDLKTMEVPNRLWVVFIPLSAVTAVANVLANPGQLHLTVMSIAFTTLIAAAIFYIGLYGGADAKALITLSIAHPTQIQLTHPLTLPFLPLTVFNNSLILMVLTLPAALIRNLYWKAKGGKSLFKGLEGEPAWKKTVALILCIKTSKSKIKPYHIPAERIERTGGEARRTLKIFQRVREEDTVIDESIPEETFITYSLPMLPFLTLGYILTITVGDLILQMVTVFLG